MNDSHPSTCGEQFFSSDRVFAERQRQKKPRVPCKKPIVSLPNTEARYVTILLAEHSCRPRGIDRERFERYLLQWRLFAFRIFTTAVIRHTEYLQRRLFDTSVGSRANRQRPVKSNFSNRPVVIELSSNRDRSGVAYNEFRLLLQNPWAPAAGRTNKSGLISCRVDVVQT